MRKVFHNERSKAGLVAAIGFSACFTALLFCILPFAHQVAKPEKTLELRKAAVADLPPPEEETQQEAPPPEPEALPPAEAQPQLAESAPQQIPVSADLDIALGAGGALAGYGNFQAATATESTAQDDAFDVADLEKPPEAVAQIAPKYPPELVKARVEGRVTVVFLLDENGRVQDPRVDSASRPEFEKPALEAIRKWRFRPGQREGQPVKTYLRQPFRFTPPA